MKYFLSFIEESIMNLKYEGFRGGRIEVFKCSEEGGDRACDEIRFFVSPKNESSFLVFRDKWDFTEVSEEELGYIRKIVEKNFCE